MAVSWLNLNNLVFELTFIIFLKEVINKKNGQK